MKTLNRKALVAIISVGCLLSSYAQESAPLGQVKDSMEPGVKSSEQVPSSAPKVSDIDRLFGDESSKDSPKKEDAASGSKMDASLEAGINQGFTLESSDLISVDYPSEEIRTVLRNVADLYSLNLVVPDSLQGATSIKLKNVTWNQIFTVVLDPIGYTYVDEGGIIKVVSKESLAFEPPVTEIFMLNYADAGTISGTISKLVDTEKGGRVQVDKRTNGLIISERASRMDELRMVIERLDKPTQQVMIETRFVEVTNRDTSDIGVNWASLNGYNIRNSDYGVEVTAPTFDSLGNLLTPGTRTLTSLNTLIGIGGGSGFEKAIFSGDEFQWVLNMLNTESRSRLVSNPTVVTLNNERAEISIAEEFPIPSYNYNDETGTFEVSGFDYKQIGVILRVTPTVNHNGLITLKVEPEVSIRNGETTFGGAGNATIPIIATRKTQTQVSLQDGYTMGIGGLMETSNIDGVRSVPVLGKIPGLGRLFRSDSKNGEKRNLLIFITARILPSEEADFEDVFSEKSMKAAGVDPMEFKNR